LIWIDKINEAIDYIEHNLFEPLNIETVGKAINYAPSSFSNIFSAVVGYSVGEYIRFRRLSEAAKQLIKENASVTDTAFMCGYDTAESFSKAFKRLFGDTPSQFAESKSKHRKFAPIKINFDLQGGFGMTRNLIPGLQKVDWSDTARQSEYVNSVVSALNKLGENTDYDYVCAVSGSAFMTAFSKEGWDFGNHSAKNMPIIHEHTFKMFGYDIRRYSKSDFETDSRLIMDSIDKGMPAIAEGVINCSNECLISGYDNDGAVLLGYNPFMYIGDDHEEAHDDTGYFRKTGWHGNMENFIIIGDKTEKPSKEAVFAETLKLVKRLISEEPLVVTHHNGTAAHKAFANALMTYNWENNFEPYMCVMCTYKLYLDRRYAVKFFEDNGRGDLAGIYKKIAELCVTLGEIIPQDFSAGDMFADKAALKPYCDVLLQISETEKQALSLL